MTEFGGIILAGGKSSRMGQDKGLMQLNGIPMISHVIEKMKEAGINEILIVTNSPSDYQQFGYKTVEDEIKDQGPIAGIYSGLMASKNQNNVILSCDVPFLNQLVLRELMKQHNQAEITITQFEGRLHPLIGIYSRNLIDSAKEHISDGILKMELFIADNNGQIIDLDYLKGRINENSFANINSLKDLKKNGS